MTRRAWAFRCIGIRSCWLKGRDDSAMTEGDTGFGVPPEVAQLQDGLARQLRAANLPSMQVKRLLRDGSFRLGLRDTV